MTGLRWLVIAACAACAHPLARTAAPVPPPAPPPVAPAPEPLPPSPWAGLPVRVMTWTPHGVQQLGELPGQLPQPMPARWYVEPIARLDEATLGRVVELVRAEHVPGLSLKNQPVAPWLAALRDLPELGALILDGTGVDGAALGAMQLTLTRLYLAHTAIDDAAVASLVERYPALEAIDVEDTAVGDAGVRAIAHLPSLHAVNLAGTQITDDGGAALAGLAELEIADLGGTRVAAKTVAALARLPLHEVFLDHTRVRGEIATLAPLAPGLVRFDVSNTAHHPTDQELAWLTGAPHLVELGASGARLHDRLAIALVALPELRTIRLAETAITNTVVHEIAARRDLEEVDLAGTPVDDASAAALLAAPEMRMLRLDATPISDAALPVPGPKLTELYLSRTSIGDLGLTVLDRIPQLTALGIGHTRAGEATIERIARLDKLHTLVLSDVRVPGDSLVRLGALHLERLYLDDSHASDAVLAALAAGGAGEALRVLHLAGSDVSDDGLPALHALTELEELTCGDTRLTEAAADLSTWPRLRTLSLTGLAITDGALPRLAARPSLVTLDLSATNVRDPSPLAGLPRLRTLGLAQTRLSPPGNAAVKRLAARGVEVVR